MTFAVATDGNAIQFRLGDNVEVARNVDAMDELTNYCERKIECLTYSPLMTISGDLIQIRLRDMMLSLLLSDLY